MNSGWGELATLCSGYKAALLGWGCTANLKARPDTNLHGRGQDALATAGGTPALQSFFRSL
jgi:hypothetical protein